MRVVFLHPDLGIGGAERLVVDAAVALQQKGHDVKVVTNHYDERHCFKETRDLEIICTAWFPRTILGKLWALCAYVRLCLAAIYVCFNEQFDVIFCDQISAALLIFKIYAFFFNSNFRTIFYCHFPDMLLTTRENALKKFYRYVIDWVEEWTTGMADVICVNSRFTASIVRSTFKSLEFKQLEVVHPSLNTRFFDSIELNAAEKLIPTAAYTFVSLNRFEVKKNVKLAIEAFVELKSLLSPEEFANCCLVIAGGYDPINAENIRYFGELKRYAEEKLEDNTYKFIRSPSDEVKVALLRRSRAVLYTPDREHFGIVPVEAMYCGSPVIAVNTGGPVETVENNKTGFLVNQTAFDFAQCMAELVKDEQLYQSMRKKGPQRVRRLFSFEAFADRMDKIVEN